MSTIIVQVKDSTVITVIHRHVCPFCRHQRSCNTCSSTKKRRNSETFEQPPAKEAKLIETYFSEPTDQEIEDLYKTHEEPEQKDDLDLSSSVTCHRPHLQVHRINPNETTLVFDNFLSRSQPCVSQMIKMHWTAIKAADIKYVLCCFALRTSARVLAGTNFGILNWKDNLKLLEARVEAFCEWEI